MTTRSATMQDHPLGWRVVAGAFLVLLGGWSAISPAPSRRRPSALLQSVITSARRPARIFQQV